VKEIHKWLLSACVADNVSDSSRNED